MDTANTLCEAAGALKERGAQRVAWHQEAGGQREGHEEGGQHARRRAHEFATAEIDRKSVV